MLVNKLILIFFIYHYLGIDIMGINMDVEKRHG
ncbi:hypothetical protein B1R32_1078 [Abditibacterium utsteinense]|uniref:Uncharacterized protein n=1 Tax=Abditibacterium utsteinense TaxID=1960156 RepID=A0A2S8ST78_9BACT|nr:hypothetical protein B1R32_1078 [Abditibacterium utsteinense]